MASVRPSGLNATDWASRKLLAAATVWPSSRGRAGSATSHNSIVPVSSPLASVCPSGLNATDRTTAGPPAVPEPGPPVRGWPSGRGYAGSATSHSRIVPSELPLASVCPSGLNATECTNPAPVAKGAGRGVFSVSSRREARSWVGWMR